MTPRALACLTALLLPVLAGAEVSPSITREPSPGAPDGSPRVLPWFGAQYSELLGWAVSVGGCVGREDPKDSWRGLVGALEPGMGGLKVLAGVGRIESSVAASFLRASWLRTWGDPGGVAPGQDYAGLEVEGMLLGVNAMVGGYRHVAGAAGEPRWLWTAGVGFWL